MNAKNLRFKTLEELEDEGMKVSPTHVGSFIRYHSHEKSHPVWGCSLSSFKSIGNIFDSKGKLNTVISVDGWNYWDCFFTDSPMVIFDETLFVLE